MAELRWLSGAGGDGWAEFAGLFTRHCREAIPDERASSADEWRESAAATRAISRSHHLLAVEDGTPVGAAAFAMDGAHPASAWMMFLYVEPQHRRAGVGTLLLDGVRTTAAAAGRDRIRTSTVLGDPGAEAFARRAGGRAGLVAEQSRCPTAGIDTAQLRAWCDRAAERASGYSLLAFDGRVPDEHLDAYVAVMPIMNTAPHAEGCEELRPSRDEVKELMEAAVREGYDQWRVCARHDATGEFVGYTQLFQRRHTPWMAAQGDTGVHPDHRERGIGRWLKAHNALRLLAERPAVEYIHTWNASVNEPMLSINRAMGFKLVARHQEWLVPARPAGAPSPV